MRVVLLGLPGAGVTTVGGLLSQRLGWPFLDGDVLLERTGSVAGALTLLLAMPVDLAWTKAPQAMRSHLQPATDYTPAQAFDALAYVDGITPATVLPDHP